ncbi:uncharacterized protein [Euphorbia lathyris]|uniref:uncharacterized protein n=1 Tax=Euphorbia lathyris TaxID=212925 RepID=UPI003313E993
MAPKSSLLGPPELHNPTLLPKRRKFQTFDGTEAINDPFMNLMVSNFNLTELPPQIDPPPIGSTEKGSATYTSSGNPCLDFFFHVVPDSRSQSIKRRLNESWNHDPLMTLKLICNLRGVRGTGKSDKEGFYTAALWLHQLHPKTLACNIPSMANFGYLKDLPEILYRILEGSDVRKNQKAEWKKKKNSGGRKGRNRGNNETTTFRGPFRRPKRSSKKSRRNRKPESTREIRISNAMERNKFEKESASFARNEKKVAMAKKVYERYSRDPDFRFLYERVSDFFSDCLKVDMEHLKSDRITEISLAAKWCPSIDSSFDRSLLLCESIARKVFSRESYPEYEGVEEAHYAYRVRDRLRKEVLVPLRKVLELPEVYIGQKRWGEIPYNRVPSAAMKLYKDKFFKHDEKRFSKYLKEAKTAPGGAMLPVDTIKSMNDDDGGQVAELQMNDLLKQGRKLKNSLAICDVSKSMNGTPMEVALTLGVFVSELSEEPWKGKLITFSQNPTLQKVQGKTLIQKTAFARTMEWGKNAGLQKVFDLILEVAVKGKLKEDEMIKRVFVFSDMEFDKASSRHDETDYQVMVRKFREKGYGNAIPEVVFWNVRDSRATPVSAADKGVALVSGFSKNLMKLFVDGNGEIDPVSVMKAAIAGEEYQNLALID